ncbi:MAG: N-acetyltransferase [Anaerolineae bacterium]|nr:N-acetyltransferase [Anaerolineae bacterium]
MSVPVTIHKVQNKSDFETFLTFPWTLYKDDPIWVPPLLSMQRHKFNKSKNPTWQHLEGDYFIARRGEQVVGTIAAFINHRHNEFQGEQIGFFGAFEVYDDQEAADALLQTAAEYVAAKGATALRGPATFSTNEECGVLIEGFDDPPLVLYPYNPPYYQRLLENAPGFVKVMDLWSYHFTLQGAGQSERVQQTMRLIRKNSERRGILVRPPDSHRLKQEFATLKDIYNQAWEKNWGFVPFSDAELDDLVANLGTFYDKRVAVFAEVKGEPAGFLLGLPDMNQVLRLAHPRPGKPELLTKLQILWHWKVRSKIKRLRLPLMGVRAEFRGIGVETAMFNELYERALSFAPQTGWYSADGGWVLETNEPMQRLCDVYNGVVYKRFRFYERTLR